MSSNSKGTSSQGPVHRARSNLSRHGLSCIHASTNLHKIPPSLCGAAWFGNVQLDQTLRASNDEAHHFALSIESHVSFGCAETWDFSVCHFTLHTHCRKPKVTSGRVSESAWIMANHGKLYKNYTAKSIPNTARTRIESIDTRSRWQYSGSQHHGSIPLGCCDVVRVATPVTPPVVGSSKMLPTIPGPPKPNQKKMGKHKTPQNSPHLASTIGAKLHTFASSSVSTYLFATALGSNGNNEVSPV